MKKTTIKKKILLLAMALALCVNFMTAHPVSADPPANDGKVAVVTLLGDSFSAGNGAGDYYDKDPKEAIGAGTTGLITTSTRFGTGASQRSFTIWHSLEQQPALSAQNK